MRTYGLLSPAEFCCRNRRGTDFGGGGREGKGLSLCGFGEAEQIISWKRALCDFLHGHVRCLIGLG